MFISTHLFAQKKIKDTVYYWADTTKVPIADRMFDTGEEGNFYYYSLTCQCYPRQANPVFTYVLKRKGVELTEEEVKKIKFITLKKLINLAVQYGATLKETAVFYFVEPFKDHYIKHQVYLLQPREPFKSIDVVRVPPADSIKPKKQNR